ncbi:MAG: hypothetical protein ACREPR_08710 [Brasilonema sp.]
MATIEDGIALSLNATVVTRNQRDFGLVPRLAMATPAAGIADWTL